MKNKIKQIPTLDAIIKKHQQVLPSITHQSGELEYSSALKTLKKLKSTLILMAHKVSGSSTSFLEDNAEIDLVLNVKYDAKNIFLDEDSGRGLIPKGPVYNTLVNSNLKQFAMLKILFDALLHNEIVLFDGDFDKYPIGKEELDIECVTKERTLKFSVPAFAGLVFLILLSDSHSISFEDFFKEIFSKP